MGKEDLRGRACIPYLCGSEDFTLNKLMILILRRMKSSKNNLRALIVKYLRLLNLISLKESPSKKGFFTV